MGKPGVIAERVVPADVSCDQVAVGLYHGAVARRVYVGTYVFTLEQAANLRDALDHMIATEERLVDKPTGTNTEEK